MIGEPVIVAMDLARPGRPRKSSRAKIATRSFCRSSALHVPKQIFDDQRVVVREIGHKLAIGFAQHIQPVCQRALVFREPE